MSTIEMCPTTDINCGTSNAIEAAERFFATWMKNRKGKR